MNNITKIGLALQVTNLIWAIPLIVFNLPQISLPSNINWFTVIFFTFFGLINIASLIMIFAGIGIKNEKD